MEFQFNGHLSSEHSRHIKATAKTSWTHFIFFTVNTPDSKPHTKTLLLNAKRTERHTKCRTSVSIIFKLSLTNVVHLANIRVF